MFRTFSHLCRRRNGRVAIATSGALRRPPGPGTGGRLSTHSDQPLRQTGESCPTCSDILVIVRHQALLCVLKRGSTVPECLHMGRGRFHKRSSVSAVAALLTTTTTILSSTILSAGAPVSAAASTVVV